MKTEISNEKDERFLNLVRELDMGYYQRIGDDLKKYEKYNEFDKPHVVILLIDSDNPIACASYRKCRENTVEFKRVYVKPEFRKRGIAYRLIKELEKDAISKNFRYSYIVTGMNNFAAIALYEKLDYELTDKFGQFKDDETVICMKKEFK